ncbi:hypothetical protein ACN28S_47065 [Cystobacter fuscus]
MRETSAEVARGFAGVKTDATGAHVLRLEEDRRMREDLTRASLLSGIIAALIVAVSCRRLTALLVVGAPVGVGLLVTFAMVQVTIGYLNIITGFLVAILIGLGIEYGLHRRCATPRSAGACPPRRPCARRCGARGRAR